MLKKRGTVMWKISRYWNRMAFGIMRLGKWMIWDQTGKNADLMGYVIDQTAMEILCDLPSKTMQRLRRRKHIVWNMAADFMRSLKRLKEAG